MFKELKLRNEIIPNYLMKENGEIYSEYTRSILSPFIDKEGNIVVWLIIDSKKKMVRLDYLVISTLSTFYSDTIRIIHLDENPLNCNIDNLTQLRKVDIINKYKEMYKVESIDDIEESWKTHKEIPIYEISNFGNVRDIESGKEIIPVKNHNYLVIYYNRKNYLLHRLVAELFVDNPKNLTSINHIDGNTLNNTFYNLEWYNPYSCNKTDMMKKYDDSTIHNVCKLLEDGLSHIDISTITGVNRKLISDIYRGRRHSKISSMYKFHKKVSLDELYNRDLIIALMKASYKPKEISDIIKIEYSQSFISYYERLKREFSK